MDKEVERPKIRELFIEELNAVKGGSDNPIEKIKRAIADPPIYSTLACGEEGPC